MYVCMYVFILCSNYYLFNKVDINFQQNHIFVNI